MSDRFEVKMIYGGLGQDPHQSYRTVQVSTLVGFKSAGHVTSIFRFLTHFFESGDKVEISKYKLFRINGNKV